MEGITQYRHRYCQRHLSENRPPWAVMQLAESCILKSVCVWPLLCGASYGILAGWSEPPLICMDWDHVLCTCLYVDLPPSDLRTWLRTSITSLRLDRLPRRLHQQQPASATHLKTNGGVLRPVLPVFNQYFPGFNQCSLALFPGVNQYFVD